MIADTVQLQNEVGVLSGFAWKSSKFKKDPCGLPIVRIQNVGSDGRGDVVYWEDEYNHRFVVREGDLLLTLSGSFRLAAWEGADALLNQRILKLTPSANLDRRFFLQYMQTQLARIERMGRHALVNNVSVTDIKNLQIPLPPLAEQKRIAGILDAADGLRAKRRESIEQLDTLLQSTFLDMFGDPVTNPMGWETSTLASHTSKVGSGATPRGGKESYKDEGVALIRSMNVRDGKFKWASLARIDDGQAAGLSNVEVEEGDVLLNITGASVARVCRAPQEVIPARVNQHVCIIRTKASVEPRFLERLLLASTTKQKLLGIGASGATRQAITKTQVLSLEVPLPPADLQRHFAATVECIEQRKARLKAHLTELDTLFASLQSRAFKGEL